MTITGSWLTVHVQEPRPEQLRITVSGTVDVLTNARLRDALMAACVRPNMHVTVDLAEARLRDSSALVTLLAARRRLIGKGGRLVLLGLTPRTRQAFARAGLSAMLNWCAA